MKIAFVMKFLALLFATSSIAIFSSPSNDENTANKKCDQISLEKIENLTPCEFTTIKDIVKSENFDWGSIN